MDDRANENRWSLSEYGKDDENWIRQTQRIPCVIAHEYARLRELCIDGNAYGVMLQLKDVMEAILKYEVLRICAIAKYEGDQVFYENIIVRGLVSKALSLGDWMQLVALCIKHYDGKRERVELAKWIARYYAKTGIVQWRNDRIGHGALALPDDDGFYAELQKYLQALHEVLTKNADQFEAHHMYCRGNRLLLARNLDDSVGNETLSFLHEGHHVPTAPFIITLSYMDHRGDRKRGIYFFDSQAQNNSATSLISYPEGKRQRIREGYFAAAKAASSAVSYAGSFVDAKFISTAEERAIERAGVGKQFVEPVHITQWLQGCMEKHSKGSFVLRMSRGMGKSTYTDKLNTLYASPHRLSDDVEVRTYHLSNLQQSGHGFERSLEWLWSSYYQANLNWYNIIPIQAYAEQKGGKREGMAAFLNECLQYARTKAQARCIVMVFDGLDEIIDEDIWSYFPKKEDLSDGVYIVYSARNAGDDEESFDYLNEQINQMIAPQEMLVIDKQSTDNIAFLNSYIADQGLALNPTQMETLIKLSDGRVLQLDMLCELLKKDVPIDDLHNDEKIVQAYVDLLLSLYGLHRKERLYTLLMVLCELSLGEGLSLSELANLARLEGTDVLLLEMLSDLMPFLRVNRGFRTERGSHLGKNRYELINADISNAIGTVLRDSSFGMEEVLVEFNRETIERMLACIQKGVPEDDGTLLVLGRYMLARQKLSDAEWSEEEKEQRLLLAEYGCLVAAQNDLDTLTKQRLTSYASELHRVYSSVEGAERVKGIYREGLILFALGRNDAAVEAWNYILPESAISITEEEYDRFDYEERERIEESICEVVLPKCMVEMVTAYDRVIPDLAEADRKKLEDFRNTIRLLTCRSAVLRMQAKHEYKQFSLSFPEAYELFVIVDLDENSLRIPSIQYEKAMNYYLRSDDKRCRTACENVIKATLPYAEQDAEAGELYRRALELLSVSLYGLGEASQGLSNDAKHRLACERYEQQQKTQSPRILSGSELIRKQIWQATDAHLWNQRMTREEKELDKLSDIALDAVQSKQSKGTGFFRRLKAQIRCGIYRFFRGKQLHTEMDETMEKLARYEAAVRHDAVSKRQEACSLYLRATSLQCIGGHFDEARQILDRVIERWEREDETSYMLTLYARLNQLQGKLQMQQQDWERAQSSFQVAYIYIGGKRPYMRRAFGTGDTNYWRSQRDWAYCLRIQGKNKDAARMYNRICTGSKLDNTPQSAIRMHWAYLMEAICEMHTRGMKRSAKRIAISIGKYFAGALAVFVLMLLIMTGGSFLLNLLMPFALDANGIGMRVLAILVASLCVPLGIAILGKNSASNVVVLPGVQYVLTLVLSIYMLLNAEVFGESIFFKIFAVLVIALAGYMLLVICYSLVLRARRIHQIKERIQR